MRGAIWCGTLVLALSCGGGGKSGGIDLAILDVADSGPSSDVAEDAPAPDAPRVAVEVVEDFRVVYGRHERFGGTAHDLYLLDPRDSDWKNDISLTEKALKKLANPLGCDLGCFVDRKMRWMAVVTAMDTKTGTYTVTMGMFATNLQVNLLKFGAIEGVRHLEFAGDYLYWTTPQPECGTPGGPPATCYQVWRLSLSPPIEKKELFTFPPTDALENSAFKGNFSVGEDDRTLLFFRPTNVSQRIYVFRDGTLKRVGDDLCSARDLTGNCIGSGTASVYRDDDPIALSPDGLHLVFALVEDNQQLRLYHHDLQTDLRRYSVLLEVPSNYFTNACYNRQPWQYKAVRSPIRFTPDGAEVLFLGWDDCGDSKNKPWTNILGVRLDFIGAGKKVTEADLRKVTDNPVGKVTKNIAISWFDLSPSGKYVTFIGTPTLLEDGSGSVPDISDRQVNDSEVYVTATDGTTTPVQLTNEVNWATTSVIAIPTPK